MGRRTRAWTVIAAGMALACAFSLLGCQKKEEKKEEKKETEVIVESKGQMEGTLVSFEGRTLIAREAGEEYTFDVGQAVINTRNMRSGDQLVIYYDGELKGTDTSGLKVTSVEDCGNNEHQTEKQAVGTLVGLTENTITIRCNDGTELTFGSNNCRHEFRNGIREGNWIVVTYIGELQGTDTKNITVVKITDDDPNVVQEEQKQMNIKAVDETVYATAGVHIRESYTTDSKVLGSLAKGGSIKRTGVCENGWSRVVYADRDAYIYGEYLTTEKPKEDAPAAKTNGEPPAVPQAGNEPQPIRQAADVQQTQAPKVTEAPTATAAPEPTETTGSPAGAQQEAQTLEGTVLDVSMNTVTVAADGQEYTLNIMDAEHEYANGIQTGNQVIVTYIGNLEDLENLIVIKVQDSDPNEGAKDAQYVGEIIDATMNTFTIRTEDDAVMTFVKDGADLSLDSIQVGIKVKVTADMTAAEVDENVFQAKQIDLADGQ